MLVLTFDVPILPQLFDVSDEPPALLQSMPEFCVLLVYEGIVLEVGDVMLFMLMAGRTCCCWG